MRIYNGVVESIDDPLRAGRVKVRVFGKHTDDKNLIPTESLPWAQVGKSTDSASISGIGTFPHGLVNGSWVKLYFEDPDEQYPFILCSVSGVSNNPGSKASYEEISFDSVREQTIAENPVISEDPTPSVPADSCELNTNLDGFYSKFGKTNPNLVLHACCDTGIQNPYAKIAILANIAKECAFTPKNEVLKYSVARARVVFPTKTSNLSDVQLAQILSTEESTGNFLYGGRYGNAANEGYKYRGRGFIQITFKANYQQASTDTGVDLVSSPDKLNEPNTAAKAGVKFIIRGAGGVGVLNGFTDQDTANRVVTQAIGGKGLNLNSGIGADLLGKVTTFSKLGYVTQEPDGTEPKKATPIGNKEADGTVSDGLSASDRQTISSSNVGFKDPTGKYPLSAFLNEPDTNRMVRQNTEKTVYSAKKLQRRTGIKNVGGDFSQPSPPYNARYPYCRGHYSESGHAIEIDDTDKQERLGMFHRTGSFFEIDSYGNRVNKIIGSDYTIIEKNGYVYVDGTLRLTCASTANVSISGNVNMVVDGSYNLDVGGDINVLSGGDIKFGASGNIFANASGNLGLDATRIDFNNGVAPKLSTSSRDPVENDYPELLADSKEMSEMIIFDDMDEQETSIFIANQIEEGKITKDEVKAGEETKPSEVVTEKPSAKIDPLPGNCSVFENQQNIPPETVLSKSFTLADLTTKVALPSERKSVAPNAGLTSAQIVCNLKKLAENCLDDIKVRFPDMIVTNTIRRNGNKSQHEKGQAADLQFTTTAPKDYYEIAKWIKDNILFDQLLLEYKNTGSKRPWIHISYSDNPRRQTLTLMNNKTHSQGLAQLA